MNIMNKKKIQKCQSCLFNPGAVSSVKCLSSSLCSLSSLTVDDLRSRHRFRKERGAPIDAGITPLPHTAN